MKLRTRLAVAFLLMSVVPLTVITIYSYNSSLRAFKRAIDAEETAIATEMGRRLETVAAAVSDRMDRISAAAQGHDWNQRDVAQDERFRREVASTLGDAAGLVAKLQFVPAPPPPPPFPGGRSLTRPGRHVPPDRPRLAPAERGRMPRGPRRPESPSSPAQVPVPPPPDVPGRPVAPDANAETPRPPTPPAAVPETPATQPIVDLVPPDVKLDPHTLEQLKTLGTLKDLAALRGLPAVVTELTRQGTLSAGALEAAARQVEIRAREFERRIERQNERRMEYQQWIARMKEGKPVGIPIQREGRTVGTMNAEISMDRVLLSVLAGRGHQAGDITFAIDPQKRLHTGDPKERDTLQKIGIVNRIVANKEKVQRYTDDQWMIVARRDPSGVIFGIARPVGAALGEIRAATGRNLGLGMLAIVVALAGIAPISRRMTRNLSVLHGGVTQIAQGDLSVRVPVRSKDEIGQLSQAFNQMAEDLGAHQKLIAERERLRGELELCRQIQNEMLPKQGLRLPFVEINGVSIPAREVGGDFFNYFVLSDNEVGLLVGDVSGKGVGAALLMANVQATLRARLPIDRDLAHLTDTIDREVEANTPSSVYLTLFVGVLDSSGRTLRYVNAGHNPQYVLRAGGGLERLASTGLPVGMFAGHGYREASLAVNDGDMLFFYTDGITEVENEAGDMFGSERLERLLVDHHSEGVDVVLKRLEQEIADFRGHAEPFDDATMMVLRLGGS